MQLVLFAHRDKLISGGDANSPTNKKLALQRTSQTKKKPPLISPRHDDEQLGLGSHASRGCTGGDDGDDHDNDLDDGVPVHRGAPEDLAVEGAEGRPDIGRHHGRLRRLLAALLQHVRRGSLLRELLSLRARGLLHHLARLHKQRAQPAHLHHLQPRLSQGLQTAVTSAVVGA